MPWIPLYQTWQIYPLQLSIDAFDTATPNLPDLLAYQPHSPIEHRCFEYHYTKLGRSTEDAINTATPNLAHIAQYTYIPKADGPPSQSNIDALNTTTPHLADIEQCTYIPKVDGPPSQLSIDALNTATPNLANLHI